MRSLIDFFDEEEFDNLKLRLGEHVSGSRSLKLSVFSIISLTNFIELLQKEHIENFNIIVQEKKDYWIINVDRVIERSDIEGGKRTISGVAYVEKPAHKRIWHIATTENLDFQKNCIERMISLLRPRISRFYLTSNEIKSIFSRFEEKKYSIMVKKAILYTHKEEGDISFEKQPYFRTFNEAEESDMYVDKIEFVIRKNRIALHGFVTREGISKFIRGDVSFFYKEFLPLLANYGEEKRIKLNEKEKKLNFEVKPLALKFKDKIIENSSENKRIVASLQNLSSSSVFIYHLNPYLHVSLFDFIDGSSCDIFVSSPDEISVIPSYTCSVFSLMRIFNQLSKDFQEGNLIEKEKKEISFMDFFE
ncbi:MAG: hypothetical protein HXS46_17410 [Theionarchaea archaeon]|nr:hypothetical protein [Theionarchaea archaeon]